MNKDCCIVRDLLPLYLEDLLSQETSEYLREHLDKCQSCQVIFEGSKEELPTIELENNKNKKENFKKIHRRLTLLQILFISLSLVLAMASSILNNSFQFILSYSIFGFLVYIFYENPRLLFTLSFLPLFLWSMGQLISEYVAESYMGLGEFILFSLANSVVISFIHVIFALIGGIIAYLVLKIRRENNE